jgi:hypothetical protein
MVLLQLKLQAGINGKTEIDLLKILLGYIGGIPLV